MRQEHHITVLGDQHVWRGFCTQVGIKPLRIELNNFEIQLMCAIPGDHLLDQEITLARIVAQMKQAGFGIVRVKHEIEAPCNEHVVGPLGETPVYYECHIKLDGPFDPKCPMASRDLFRERRWYITHRSHLPFDYTAFLERTSQSLRRYSGAGSAIVGYEYEACIRDTHPGLDARWR